MLTTGVRQVRSVRRAVEGAVQHGGQELGGQMGLDDHRPQTQAGRQDPGLWRQECGEEVRLAWDSVKLLLLFGIRHLVRGWRL